MRKREYLIAGAVIMTFSAAEVLHSREIFLAPQPHTHEDHPTWPQGVGINTVISSTASSVASSI